MRDLLEAAYDFELPKDAKDWAAHMLGNWGKAELNLRHLTIHELAKLIIGEVNGRRRQYVVKRLLSRYSKLRSKAELGHLYRIMEEKNEGVRNRGISLSTCGGSGRDSNKTDILG